MRSVVAEASSIAKAIELAWQKAGQPKEFLTKVFQEPQRNMFGLTKTTAKVGIFFDDVTINNRIKSASQHAQPVTHIVKPASQISNQTNKSNNPNKVTQPKPQAPKPLVQKPQSPKVQTTKPNVQKPVRSAQDTKTNPVHIKEQQPAPAQSIMTDLPNAPVNQLSVAQPNTSAQIITPMPKQVSAAENVNLSTENTSANTASSQQRPARSKYYRRRKPRSPRPNNGDNSGSDKTAMPNNHAVKHED